MFFDTGLFIVGQIDNKFHESKHGLQLLILKYKTLNLIMNYLY